jgi:hypothetical protein
MISIIKDLNPTKEYSFRTSPSGWTSPMTVKQLLMSSREQEIIIMISEGTGLGAKNVWSLCDGWYANLFSELVSGFVTLIDREQTVNPEFIDSALNDDLSVSAAVASWFEGSEISVEVEHHAQGHTGLMDIDIKGIGSSRRAVLNMNRMKKGEMFNVYYGESSKGGAFWDKDLVTTLKGFFGAKDAPFVTS